MYVSNRWISMSDEAKINIEGSKITVSGKLGTLTKDFSNMHVKLELKDGQVMVSGDKRLVRTVQAHIKNMITGVTKGYTKKLKVVYAHFPITTEVKGNDIIIKNFLGEKQPRKAKISGKTKVEVKGQEVILTGPSKEDIGQTIANLKSATRIKDRDPRVFQDGYYVIEEEQ
jgi:large subunit ribosomal protein L6